MIFSVCFSSRKVSCYVLIFIYRYLKRNKVTSLWNGAYCNVFLFVYFFHFFIQKKKKTYVQNENILNSEKREEEALQKLYNGINKYSEQNPPKKNQLHLHVYNCLCNIGIHCCTIFTYRDRIMLYIVKVMSCH